MKLLKHYANASKELTEEDRAELDAAVDSLSDLVAPNPAEPSATMLLREGGSLTCPMPDLRAHLTAHRDANKEAGMTSHFFRSALVPAQEGHHRLVCLRAGHELVCDVLVE